jgi:helix-turn-helix protein
MDKESLERWLTQGLSLATIGQRVGRDPSTVGYWVAKYGLKAVGSEKHRAQGGVDKERLAELVNRGLTCRAMADEFGP